MSPVSRSRKPKRTVHHPARPEPASPFAPLLADAEQLVALTDPLAAELWASDLLGSMFDAAWEEPEAEPDPDELFELELTGLLDYLESQRRPAALAALRALASVGEEWTRELALAAAEPLTERGVKEPAWLANAHEPSPCGLFAAADEFGDRELISLAFDRAGEVHVLTALIMHGAGRELVTLTMHLGFDPEELKSEIADTQAMREIELDPAQARTRLEDVLELLLCREPEDFFDEDDEEAQFSDPKLFWPLLAVRLELLPIEDEDEHDHDHSHDHSHDHAHVHAHGAGCDHDSEPATDYVAQVREAVGGFLASPRAADLADPEFAGQLVTVLADVAVVGERGPCGFGPLALALTLDGESINHLALTERQLDQFAPVLTAWAHFTADTRGLSAAAHEAWDAQLPDLVDQFREAYLDPEAVAHRAECPDVIPIEKFEPSATMDEQGLAEDLARILAEATGIGAQAQAGTESASE
ncbi:MAG TPA: hypothetical protein VGX23_34650 [Actinocrinis sp.]|nr:hypothetical protein [Actinocrinis sp.]